MSQTLETPSTPDPLLTVGEVAAEARISKQTVSRLIISGKLKAENVGAGTTKHYRIRRSWLDAFHAGPPPAQHPSRPVAILSVMAGIPQRVKGGSRLFETYPHLLSQLSKRP